jgi:adenylate kinase family enzyme
VPVLTCDDPLPARPRRVLVAGGSGSGKTTLAGRVSQLLDVQHVEIDALFHGPGWTPRPEFVADVERFSSGPAWVTEWQYGAVRALLAQRADLLLWLDLPRSTVMRQVVRRTVARRLGGHELWNGNREAPLWTVLTDDEHVIRWAWHTHGEWPGRVAQVAARHPDLPVVRLRRHAEAERWLRGPLTDVVGRDPLA